MTEQRAKFIAWELLHLTAKGELIWNKKNLSHIANVILGAYNAGIPLMDAKQIKESTKALHKAEQVLGQDWQREVFGEEK